MRIVEDTPERLVIEHRTPFQGGFYLLLGVALAVFVPYWALRGEVFVTVSLAILAAGCLWGGFYLFIRTRTVLDRASGEARVARKGLMRSTVRAGRLSDVDEAVKQTQRGEDGGIACRVALKVGRETWPLAANYGDPKQADAVLAAVTRFLRTN